MVGHFDIGVLLGKGGMGEVYRARDTRLGRDVALKVLSPALANDRDYLARFEREAQVLASLNHPNIAQIYGIEGSAIVMELVEGPTLADRIASGSLPFDEAVAIARQIAEALEAAHERGVVHRDLKPANVKITAEGVVKVLDFGLAKAAEPVAAAASGADSPTLSLHATRAGVILGTAAYMSPEQASGKPVDKRTDIWAFGVVLCEMFSGRQMFAGETVSHTLAEVLKSDIDLSPIPDGPVRQLAARCLDRRVRTRLRDIGEARIALEEPSRAIVPVVSKPSKLPWAIAAIALGVAVLAAWFAWPKPEAPRPVMRLYAELNADAAERGSFAISSDGTRLFYHASTSGQGVELRSRGLDGGESAAVRGVSGIQARTLFAVSAAGEWMVHGGGGKLIKVNTSSGVAEKLADSFVFRGADFFASGDIVASAINTPLLRFPAAGGKPVPLTDPAKTGDVTHRWPQILPGEGAILFTAGPSTGSFLNDSTVNVLNVATGAVRTLVRGGSFGRYTGDRDSGHLLYVFQDELFAAAFDPKRLELVGTPKAVLTDVASDPSIGLGNFSVTRDGTLVYRSGNPAETQWPLYWLDATGKATQLPGKLNAWAVPRISPDGKWLAVQHDAGYVADSQIWIHDLERGAASQLFSGGVKASHPVWAPDSKHIVFRRLERTGKVRLYWTRADGSGDNHLLLEGDRETYPHSFSPDGRTLTYTVGTMADHDIWVVSLDLADPERPRAGNPQPLIKTSAREISHAVSPDGRWIAYESVEASSIQIFVKPFGEGGGRWQISTEGGMFPAWSRNGRELFFQTTAGRLHVVEYSVRNDEFQAGKPRLWSDRRLRHFINMPNADIHPDGKRFIVTLRSEAAETPSSSRLTVVVNFADELRRRLPLP